MRILCLLTVCSVASAQSYIVKSNDAKFMDGEKVVAPAKAGTPLYVKETRDGWGKVIEPTTLKPAWISLRAIERRQFSDEDRAIVRPLIGQLKTFQAIIDQNTCSAEDFARTKRWAEELTGILGEVSPMSGTCARFVGDAALKAGAIGPAVTWYKLALKRKQLIDGRKGESVALVYVDLAEALLQSGEVSEAFTAIREAYEINKVVHGRNSPLTTQTYHLAGRAMALIGEHQDALDFYRKAQPSYKKEYGLVHYQSIRLDRAIASTLLKLGQKAEAIKTFESCLDRGRELVEGTNKAWIAGLERDLQYAGLDASNSEDVAAFQQLLIRQAEQYPASRGAIGRIQLQLVDAVLEVGDSQQVLSMTDEMLKQLRTRLRTGLWGMSQSEQRLFLGYVGASRFFQAIRLAVRFKDDPQALRLSAEWLVNAKGLVREAQTVQAGTLEDLSRRDAWADESYVELSAVVARLPRDGAFVDILQFPVEETKTGSAKQHYGAWVTKPDGSTQYLDLGETGPIDSAIDKLRVAMLATADEIEELGEIEATKKLRPHLVKVSEMLWNPIRLACGDATQLILSPDGATWIVPWSAMVNADGSYAIESHALELQLSGRTLVQRNSRKELQAPVIFADPSYGPASAGNSPRRGVGFGFTLEPVKKLKYSSGEAAAVQPSVDRIAKSPAKVLLSGDAREERFKALKSPEIIVLSTHGFFANPESSADAEQVRDTDPLLQCGLLLADANRSTTIGKQQNDGVLTGAEIAATDLSGTKLAVLSACQTGIGSLEVTGGVVGLRSAFHVAGAESVLASLWLVDDLDTAFIMKRFFAELATSRDVRASLQAAQRSHIATRRKSGGAAHPYYWAAFTLSGHTTF